MPVYDFECRSCHVRSESYLPKWDAPDPACERCGAAQERLFSRFGVVFTGVITASKYKDPKREDAHTDGVWCYRRRSSLSGQPEPVYLETHQELREFCKAEGLYDPSEVPRNMEIGADGKTLSSTGMPGQWQGGYNRDLIPSRVWEMDKSLTSLHGKDPAPQASGPPCTAAVADAATMDSFHYEPGAGGSA